MLGHFHLLLVGQHGDKGEAKSRLQIMASWQKGESGRRTRYGMGQVCVLRASGGLDRNPAGSRETEKMGRKS